MLFINQFNLWTLNNVGLNKKSANVISPWVLTLFYRCTKKSEFVTNERDIYLYYIKISTEQSSTGCDIKQQENINHSLFMHIK